MRTRDFERTDKRVRIMYWSSTCTTKNIIWFPNIGQSNQHTAWRSPPSYKNPTNCFQIWPLKSQRRTTRVNDMGSKVVLRRDSSDLDGQEGTEKVEDELIWVQINKLIWIGRTLLVNMITNGSLYDGESWSWRSIETSSYQEKADNAGQRTPARRGLSSLSDKVKYEIII